MRPYGAARPDKAGQPHRPDVHWRVARWGEWRANWVYLKVGVLWGLNIRPRALGKHYPDVR